MIHSKHLFLLGSFLYTVVWLFVLPAVAGISAVAAVLGLSLLTGFYCFAVARMKGRNETLWAILGAACGFLEIGIIPVLVVSFVGARLASTERS